MSRIRVAAYVLRERKSWELLVFEHVGIPEAGLQIPAGGVRPDEPVEMAVVREVFEETGLRRLTIRSQLHTEHKPHPTTGIPRTTTFFAVDASDQTSDRWKHLVEGDGADAGMTFHCRFVQLPLSRPLADDQDAGLGLIDPDFTTLGRRRG